MLTKGTPPDLGAIQQPATGRSYILLRHPSVQTNDVNRILHYVTDFDGGDARGHAFDGGWCICRSDPADANLLLSQ